MALALGAAMLAHGASASANAQAITVTLAPPPPVLAQAVAVTIAPAPVSVALVPPAPAIPVAVKPLADAPFAVEAMAGWSAQEVASARIRSLQAMLMVGSLRCRAIGIDVLADYNAFVDAARATLGTANDDLKARFAAVYGKSEGQDRYDRYATAMANGFGAGATTPAICAAVAATARSATAAASDRPALLALADNARLQSGLPQLEANGVEIAAR